VRPDPRIAAAALSTGNAMPAAKQPAAAAAAPADQLGPSFATPPQPARPSAVFDEDPESALSIGAIPWLVLGATLLILVGWWLLH
jgi:hypothetical protein